MELDVKASLLADNGLIDANFNTEPYRLNKFQQPAKDHWGLSCINQNTLKI